jgi:hypothetical protein
MDKSFFCEIQKANRKSKGIDRGSKIETIDTATSGDFSLNKPHTTRRDVRACRGVPNYNLIGTGTGTSRIAFLVLTAMLPYVLL